MNHEEDTIRAFLIPTRRQRYLGFVSNPRTRIKFIRELAHFKDLDGRYVQSIPSSKQHAKNIADLLWAKHAPKTCWVISENPSTDGRELPLLEALQETVGRGMGTFLSCIPGRLAFFESEDERCILERRD